MEIITLKFDKDMVLDAFPLHLPKNIAVLDGDKVCGKRDEVMEWFTEICKWHNTPYNCEIKSLQDDADALSQAEAMYQYTESTTFQKIYEDLGLVEV